MTKITPGELSARSSRRHPLLSNLRLEAPARIAAGAGAFDCGDFGAGVVAVGDRRPFDRRGTLDFDEPRYRRQRGDETQVFAGSSTFHRERAFDRLGVTG